jgi:hypothetical protein
MYVRYNLKPWSYTNGAIINDGNSNRNELVTNNYMIIIYTVKMLSLQLKKSYI